MNVRHAARALGLACIVTTLLATSACGSSNSSKGNSPPTTPPDTATVTLPSATAPGSISINVTVPLTAAMVGSAKSDRERLAHVIANGVSVSLVPVANGTAASPLHSALTSMQFAPNPGKSGAWKVNGSKSTLSASRLVGDEQTSGTFAYSGTKGCDGAATDCGGQLSIDVAAELSDAAATRLATQFERNPGAMALTIANSNGLSVSVPTTPVKNAATSSAGRVTVSLDPATTIPAASRVGGSTAIDEIVDAAFSPVAAQVRPAGFGGQRSSTRSAVMDGTTSPNLVPVQVTSDGSGCGSVMAQTAEGLGIATGFIGLVPVVGPALGAVTNSASFATAATGANAGDACIQAQFEVINAQLANQEEQIQNLQTEYLLQQNEIYQLMVAGANAQTNLDLTNYDNALQAISPSANGGNGIFGNFMINLGFWNANYTAVSGASIAGSSSSQTFLTTVSASTSEAATFAANLNSLSGSAVDVTACSATACPQSAVAANLSSSLVMLWSSEAQQLQATFELERSQGTNVVPLFDQYNNTISEQFQNSLAVLQQAFSLEAMVNQLNYDHATSNCSWGQSKECTNIDSFGGVPGTWFGYCQTLTNGACAATSTAAETTAYNLAQYRLAQIYAWRVNLLYEAALSFLFTDAPIGPQGYPTTTASGTIAGRTITNGPIPYAALLGSALTGVAGVHAATPMASLPAAATSGAAWTGSGVLYQYSAIFDANGCANVIIAANQSGGAAAAPPSDPCPPAIFLTAQGGAVDQAQYTGSVLQPYTSLGGSVTLAGLLQANLLMCNPSSPELGWYSPPAQNTGNAAGLVSGQWYLNCGNWATITNSSVAFPGATFPQAWTDPVSGATWLQSGYYSWSTTPWSPTTFYMSFEISGQAVNFAGASGCGSNDPVFYSSGTSSNYTTSSSPCYLAMAVKSDASYSGVTGLQTTNQGGSGSGLQIPIMWNQSYSSKNNANWTWQPQPVPAAEMGIYGFTCNFQTCTLVDGSVWTVTYSFAAPAGCPSDCIPEEILNLGLSQVS